MDEFFARESIGRNVIAYDEYWGTYLGELVDIFHTYTCWRARVKIIEILVMPSQCAVFFKDKHFHRDPYQVGSIHNFNLIDVSVDADQLAG